MRKVFFSLMLLCGLAMVSTSCKDNNNGNNGNVTPEVESGEMTVGSNTSDIVTAKAVNYGQKNAIVLASKEMTASNNEGIAIIFNGAITPGTYTMGDTKDPVPTVVGFHEFNLGELPFIMGADTLFYGDTYYWMNGVLSVTENNGTYTVILSQSMGTNANGQTVQLAINFSGTLPPYQFNADNKFKIGDRESPIGLAGITTISGMGILGDGVKSMLFMSADHKRSFIVSYLTGQLVDGEYELGYNFGTPYLPKFPCVHVALDSDFWTMTPQTGYIAKEGTLKVVTNDDGTKTVTMENLKLKNVEHDSEFLWPILDGSLVYHGYMYELSL